MAEAALKDDASVRFWKDLRRKVPGGLSVSELHELCYWACGFQPHEALEVGHWNGLSTVALLHALPGGCRFTTIDHHLGDDKISRSSRDTFLMSVADNATVANLSSFHVDFRDWKEALDPRFMDSEVRYDFVFYDAQHTTEASSRFWSSINWLIDSTCLLLYDDADWDGMKPLGDLAIGEGFEDVTRRPLQRLPGDKNNPETYTLRVLRRG